MCKCGCNTCETKKPTLILNESLAPRAMLSKGLRYHIDNNKPLNEHLCRIGSRDYLKLFAEARSLYSRGILEFNNKVDLTLLTETNLGHFGIFEGKKVPLDFPIKLTEGYDVYDEIANAEFGMDYDQLGSNEKEWVRDEIDNMEMRESLNEAIYTDPNTGKSYDLQFVSSKNRWELDIMKKGASIYSNAITTIKRKTVEEIIDWLEGYNIDSSWVKKSIVEDYSKRLNENEYYVTRNKGRGQGKGLVKSVESDFTEPRVFSKEEAEVYVKRAQSGGAIPGQMIAYWVSDKDMNRVDESIGKDIYIIYKRDRKTKKVVKEILK